MWVRIELPYAVFGIKVDMLTLKIVDAAPVGRWMIGKDIETVDRWIRGKNGMAQVLQLH